MEQNNPPFKVEFYTTRRGDSPPKDFLVTVSGARQTIMIATIDNLAAMRGRPEAIDIKKVVGGVWRLRSGDYRVLYGIVKETVVVLSVFRKKTQRLEIRDIRKAVDYFEDYIKRRG